MSSETAGLCRDCATDDHSYHRPSLGGICIGCTCPVNTPDPTEPPSGAVAADTVVYCRHCRRAITTRPWTQGDGWIHAHHGLVECDEGASSTAEPDDDYLDDLDAEEGWC